MNSINLFSAFPPVKSGLTAYSVDLAAALQAEGAPVHCVNRGFWRNIRFGSAGVYRTGLAKRLDYAMTLCTAPLYKRPPASDATVNHFQLSCNLWSYPLVRHFYGLKGLRVITVHEQPFVAAGSNPFSPYDRGAQARMLAAADLIIVHTDELAAKLRSCSANVAVLPHGVSGRRFAIDREAAKRRIGVTGPLVTQIGFLFHGKGAETFIRAAPEIPATLLIVGSGPDEKRLRHLAERHCPGKIVFHPYVSEEEYPSFIAASDVIVFPRLYSQGECSGVMVQAMAAGKAIVANDMGCYREYLKEGRGVLVESGNRAAFVAAIGALLADPARRMQHEGSAKAFAQRAMEWNTVAKQHLELYARSLQHREKGDGQAARRR